MQKNIYVNEKQVLKDIIPLEMPLVLSIEPSNLCNFKCAMCFHGNNEQDERAKPLANMTEEIFAKILQDIKSWTIAAQRKLKLIKLYSLGEPLINKGICDMLARIKAADVCEKVEITTNASLLSEEVAKQLVDFQLDILRVSVYSVRDKRMKEVTRSNVMPETIYNNVKAIRAYRDSVKSDKPIIYAKMLDANNDENEEFVRKFGGWQTRLA